MPKQTGMLYGAGLATIIKVSPLPAGPRPALIPMIAASAPKVLRPETIELPSAIDRTKEYL
jgi:hypothetical protein